jgi:hypothetical protein
LKFTRKPRQRSQEKGPSSEISKRIDPRFLQEIGLSASSS